LNVSRSPRVCPRWRNNAGIPQFPDALAVLLDASGILSSSRAYVPLERFESTARRPRAEHSTFTSRSLPPLLRLVERHAFAPQPSTGGLTLRGGKSIADGAHIDLAAASEAEFDAVWSLIDYTLEFSRGELLEYASQPESMPPTKYLRASEPRARAERRTFFAGVRDRSVERAAFRRGGKMCWTSAVHDGNHDATNHLPYRRRTRTHTPRVLTG